MTDLARLEKVADAVLYEGYLLYPYDPRALKNQRRWTFGCLLPEPWSAALGEPSWHQAECLVRGEAASRLAVRFRFLRLDGTDAVDARLDAPVTTLGELVHPLVLRRAFGRVEAELHVWACAAGDGVYRVRVRLDNVTTPDGPCPAARDEALSCGLLSCHALLAVEGGAFLSSIAPPAPWAAAAAACRNVGLWPVLAGDPAAPAAMIAAPIILYDHPQVAAQSPADTFDATEMDEMIRLHLLALTDGERAALADDGRARQLLERVSGLSESEVRALHGTWRVGPRPGDRVRLRPGRRADLLDLTLAGREATVVSVDEDLEGRRHVSVVIDDDPGRDLGLAGWPGHRFFFSADEVEALP